MATTATKSTATTVAFRGAYNPKLANVAVNQKITTTKNGIGTEPVPDSSTRQRALTIS